MADDIGQCQQRRGHPLLGAFPRRRPPAASTLATLAGQGLFHRVDAVTEPRADLGRIRPYSQRRTPARARLGKQPGIPPASARLRRPHRRSARNQRSRRSHHPRTGDLDSPDPAGRHRASANGPGYGLVRRAIQATAGRQPLGIDHRPRAGICPLGVHLDGRRPSRPTGPAHVAIPGDRVRTRLGGHQLRAVP